MLRYCVRVKDFECFSLQQFLIYVCRKLPFFIPTAVVNQKAKVHGSLCFLYHYLLLGQANNRTHIYHGKIVL